jgi:hypothetical protein
MDDDLNEDTGETESDAPDVEDQVAEASAAEGAALRIGSRLTLWRADDSGAPWQLQVVATVENAAHEGGISSEQICVAVALPSVATGEAAAPVLVVVKVVRQEAHRWPLRELQASLLARGNANSLQLLMYAVRGSTVVFGFEHCASTQWCVLRALKALGKQQRLTAAQEVRVRCYFALKLGAEVGDALASLHGSGLIHRDLKPDNVFVKDLEAFAFKLGTRSLLLAASLLRSGSCLSVRRLWLLSGCAHRDLAAHDEGRGQRLLS